MSMRQEGETEQQGIICSNNIHKLTKKLKRKGGQKGWEGREARTLALSLVDEGLANIRVLEEARGLNIIPILLDEGVDTRMNLGQKHFNGRKSRSEPSNKLK